MFFSCYVSDLKYAFLSQATCRVLVPSDALDRIAEGRSVSPRGTGPALRLGLGAGPGPLGVGIMILCRFIFMDILFLMTPASCSNASESGADFIVLRLRLGVSQPIARSVFDRIAEIKRMFAAIRIVLDEMRTSRSHVLGRCRSLRSRSADHEDTAQAVS